MALLTPTPKQQFFDANGAPLVGGKLYTYQAGTTTPLVSYVDSSGLVANTNPVILNSRGEADVWLGGEAYKFKLTTSTDVEIWTVDNITSIAQLAAPNGSSLVGFIAAGAQNPQDARTVQSKLRDTISVKDFGAVGDGTTDDWQAIQDAVDYAAGKSKIIVPQGTYIISKEIKLPSDSWFEGQGVGNTVIKLANSAALLENVITSSNNNRSENTFRNYNIVVTDMTLDGNYQRFSSWSGTGSQSGCCISIVATSNVLISRIYAKDPSNHCIEIGASFDPGPSNADPTYYPPLPSENVRIEFCEASGAGDDSITTHYSGNIEIYGCYVHDSNGHKVPENSNGIEIDDGSYDVTIFGCYAARCQKGLQIKGHVYGPAPTRIKVFGMTAESCTRNFQIRHQGFEVDAEPDSATAYAVELHGCVSIRPALRAGSNVSPRAIQVASYNGVLIEGFTNFGTNNFTPPDDPEDPDEDATSSLISFERGCRNVVARDIKVVGATGASRVILIGGSRRGDVTLENAVFIDCLGVPVYASAPQDGIQILGVYAQNGATDAGKFTIGQQYTISVVGSTNFVAIGAASNTVGVVFTATGVGSGTGTATPILPYIVQVTSQPQTYNYTVENVKGIGYTNLMTTGTVAPRLWNEFGLSFKNKNIFRLSETAELNGSDVLFLSSNSSAKRQLVGTSTDNSASANLVFNTTDTSAGEIALGHSRGSTRGTPGIVQTDDRLGQIWFTGDDGAGDVNGDAKFMRGGGIVGVVKGTPGVDDIGCEIQFRTRTTGDSTTPIVRAVVEHTGATRPGSDNLYSLGTASFLWSVVYAATGSINTSDARAKQQIREITETERAVAVRCKGLLKAFKFNNAVDKKGENARIHFGVIAQDVKAAFEAEGLNAEHYGLFCYDSWDAAYAPVYVTEQRYNPETESIEDYQVDTGERTLVTPAGGRYGVRYEELLAFIIGAM